MSRQVRVWGWAVVTAASWVGLEGVLAAAAKAQGQRVLSPGPASLDEVIATLAAATALLLGAWLAVSSIAAVLAHVPGRLGARAGRLAAAWAPLVTRRLAAALVGAAVGSTLGSAAALAGQGRPFPGFTASVVAAGAAASTGTPPSDLPTPGWSPQQSVPARPSAGWTPSRPTQRPVTGPGLVSSGVAHTTDREVVVHRGDTLWDLVAAHLGPDATDAEVAAAWPRWHTANLTVIGDDPDRLLPGQVLRVPTAALSR